MCQVATPQQAGKPTYGILPGGEGKVVFDRGVAARLLALGWDWGRIEGLVGATPSSPASLNEACGPFLIPFVVWALAERAEISRNTGRVQRRKLLSSTLMTVHPVSTGHPMHRNLSIESTTFAA